MSSLNPVVGVSLCIGALGAGLAYLAWNNQDDEVDQTTNEKVNTAKENNDAVGEKTTETKETTTETKETTTETKETIKEEDNSTGSSEKQDVELKTIKVTNPDKKQSNMKQFLKESYEDSKQD